MPISSFLAVRSDHFLNQFIMFKHSLSVRSAITVFGLLLLFLPLTFAFADAPDACETCIEPSPQATQISSSSISFSWAAVTGATGYEAKWTRSDGVFSKVYFTTTNDITFSNLTSGTYQFRFRTICGKQTSGWIITEDFILK